MFDQARSTLTSLLLTAGAAASMASGAPAQSNGSPQVDINHEELAAEFLKRSGFYPAAAAQVSTEDLLQRSFFTMRIGVFDLGLSSYAALSRSRA